MSRIADNTRGEERIRVDRYNGSCLIRESLEAGRMRDAVSDTYFLLEKELIDRIVLGQPGPELQMQERLGFQEDKEKTSKSPKIRCLISKAATRNLLSKSEKEVIEDFLEQRNLLIHQAGYWHTAAKSHDRIAQVVLRILDLLDTSPEKSATSVSLENSISSDFPD